MPALKQAPVGKKKLIVNNDKQVSTVFSRVFSPIFYDKVVKKAFNHFKITTRDIVRINQYVSDDHSHIFITVFFKYPKMISEADNKIFKKEMKKLLLKTGYFGPIKNTKFTKLYNSKSRRAVELPIVWKSKSLGGSYCMLFERFS